MEGVLLPRTVVDVGDLAPLAVLPALRRVVFFFFNAAAPTELYPSPYTLSLHDALPISSATGNIAWNFRIEVPYGAAEDFLPRSEEHTSELQSHGLISYAVFCLKKKMTDDECYYCYFSMIGKNI